MSSITIRKLDPAVKERLRVRAARHGRSMEAEARRILQSALSAYMVGQLFSSGVVPARHECPVWSYDTAAAAGNCDLDVWPAGRSLIHDRSLPG